MRIIATLVTDLFEDIEYQQPVAEFRKAGHTVENIGFVKGEKIKGLDSHTIQIDRNVRNVLSRNYDALFIPGGYSPDKLREDDNVINFVRDFMSREKPLFVVGHGLQLLISARMLAGRRVAGRKSLAQDIANAGGFLSGRKVMIDSNLITCSSANDLPTFTMACLHRLSAKQQKK